MRLLAILTGIILFSLPLSAQDKVKVVQFSGRVISMEDDRINELIYTNIAVKGTARGAVSDIDGFFSLPVRETETVVFSRIGYETKEFQVPEGLEGNLYSKDIILAKDTLFLPEAFIYPWPDKDYFKIEFLALEVSNPIEELAQENLAPEQQAYYYVGQTRPMNIFNPLSWKKFIDAIKNGDFKKKE